MTDRTALGDRMKRYEATYRHVLPKRTYTILRLDGRAFHTYLRGAVKPYDETFMTDMDAVTAALCAEVSGAKLAYTQSDEISILITDFATPDTEPWFGGVTAKILSVSASFATAVLNERRPGKRALFDARAFTLSDAVEVANYFIWRQRDAVRNSITMAAQAKYSPKQLHGVKSGRMQEMLFVDHGINWNDYPGGCKRGRVAIKQEGDREVVYEFGGRERRTVATRSWWEVDAAPTFTADTAGFLAAAIPPLPSLNPVGTGPYTEETE